MTLEAKTLFVAMLVGLAHIVSGIAVLAAPAAMEVTHLSMITYLISLVGWGGGAVGSILIFAGFMAVVGASIIALPRVAHGLLFLPQQILLLVQIWSIAIALNAGQYPDGYHPEGGAWFILTDQIWAFILAVTHSFWLAAFLYGGRTDGISGSSV
jgi:hypothetical protein